METGRTPVWGVYQRARAASRRRPAPSTKTASATGGLLGLLLLLLASDAQSRDGTNSKPLRTDRLLALLTEPERSVFDSLERLVDLADELPFAIANAQFEVALTLHHATVGGIGESFGLIVAHVVGSAIRFAEQLVAATFEQLAESDDLVRSERFGDRGSVALQHGPENYQPCITKKSTSNVRKRFAKRTNLFMRIFRRKDCPHHRNTRRAAR